MKNDSRQYSTPNNTMRIKSTNKIIHALALLGLMVPMAATAAVVITPTSVTASSELTSFSRQAINSINGSGLTGDGSAGSTVSEGEAGVAWTTPGNLGGGFGTDFDPEITFDLGGLYNVSTIREWGYNSAFGPIGTKPNISIVGPNSVEVFAGATLGSMVSMGTVNFALAPGVDGYVGNDIAVSFTGVQFIRLDILTNYDGAIFDGTGTAGGVDDGRSLTGLSEIRFEGTVVPEPSAFALFGLGAIGLVLRRRR